MIPEGIDGDSRRKIKIFLSFRIIEINSFPSLKNHRETIVGMQDLLLCLIHQGRSRRLAFGCYFHINILRFQIL